MTLDKVILHFEPEDKDVQETSQMNFLVGKLKPYRISSSFTHRDIRTVPEHARLEYVRRNFRSSIQEFHDFSLQQVKKHTFPLDNDHFVRIFEDDYWDIVLTTPKRTRRVRRISQTTELFVKKITEENFSYLLPEINSLGNLDSESALRLATTLEDSLNISKLEAVDPFLKRIIEDLQWNMIDIKKALSDIVYDIHVKRGKEKLEKNVNALENKILALEDIKKAFAALGVDEKEVLKEFSIKDLPNGRVEFVWKKSG